MREAKQLTRAAARTSGTALSNRIVLSHAYSRAMELGDLDRAEHFARMIGDADEAKGQTQGASATQRFLIARERLALEPMRVSYHWAGTCHRLLGAGTSGAIP